MMFFTIRGSFGIMMRRLTHWSVFSTCTAKWSCFLRFLENDFNAVLNDMSLVNRANRWFQLDGCPAHYTTSLTKTAPQFSGKMDRLRSRLPPFLAYALSGFELLRIYLYGVQ